MRRAFRILAFILSLAFATPAWTQLSTSAVTGILSDATGTALANTVVLFNVPQQTILGNVVGPSILSAKTDGTGNLSINLARRAIVQVTVGSGAPIQAVVCNAATCSFAELITRTNLDPVPATVPAASGGTGINSSASTGVAVVTAGTWSIDGPQLDANRGGTNIDSSGSSGLPRIATGTWSVIGGTGTARLDSNVVSIADVKLESYTKAGLPAAGTAGRLARVTDSTRCVWMDTGTRWFSICNGIVNAEEFGMKDDSTDNLTAFQAAIDATPVGAILEIPYGTFRVNGEVNRVQATATVNNCIHIRGAGRGTIIKQMSATANTIRISADVTGDQMSGCVIENLFIAYPTGATAGDAILFERIHRSLIRNVWVPGAGGAAVHIKGGFFNTLIHSGTSTAFDVGFATTRPKRGLFLDVHPAGPLPSNANTFIGTVWENVTTAPGIAVDLASGQGNTFVGGGMQSSTVGLQVSNDEYAFLGPWLEANTTRATFTKRGGFGYFSGEQESFPANPSGAYFNWVGTSGASLSTIGTNFISPVGVNADSGNEQNKFIPIDSDIRVRRFHVTLSAAPGVGNSYVFTLRKNVADSLATVTISGTSTSATSTTEDTWAVTDLMSIKLTTTGTPAAATARWAIQLQNLAVSN